MYDLLPNQKQNTVLNLVTLLSLFILSMVKGMYAPLTMMEIEENSSDTKVNILILVWKGVAEFLSRTVHSIPLSLFLFTVYYHNRKFILISSVFFLDLCSNSVYFFLHTLFSHFQFILFKASIIIFRHYNLYTNFPTIPHLQEHILTSILPYPLNQNSYDYITTTTSPTSLQNL